MKGVKLNQHNHNIEMLNAIFALGYGVIALVVMGMIASEGIDDGGNVYDDTAITMGLALGLLWPIAILGFAGEKLVIALGKEFN